MLGQSWHWLRPGCHAGMTAYILSHHADARNLLRTDFRNPASRESQLNEPYGRAIGTRQGLYKIVKERLATAANALRDAGELDLAADLDRASPHWLRHTFAKAALMKGQSMREVASLLGHASVADDDLNRSGCVGPGARVGAYGAGRHRR